MIQRRINYRISYGNYWKEFDGHFNVEFRCKDCHLIADMAFFSINYLALKWNYFFLSGIIVFVEYFNLYMKQLGFNPEPDPEGCHRGLKGLSRSAWLPSLAYFLILDSESEVKKKRRGRDLRHFVVFVLAPCCWDDSFKLELLSLMTI